MSAEVVRLRVPTFTEHGAQLVHLPDCIDPCICTCVPHTAERDQAVARGVRPDLPQPYVPKPPRALPGAA